MRMEIDRMKYENGELSPSNENSIIKVSSFHIDMDIQPFSSECENTMYLRDIADSTCIPDSMKEVISIDSSINVVIFSSSFFLFKNYINKLYEWLSFYVH